MIYSPICGEKVSRLGLGTMNLPTLEGRGGIDREAAAVLVQCALECGVNFFDTSHIYHAGEAEDFLGETLQGVRREVYLADKYSILSEKDHEAAFEGQLERLRTDAIDFYMLHGVMDYTVDAYLESGCIDYFLRQKERGRIRHFGFSLHAGAETLRRVCDAADWDFVQLQLNYMDWKYARGRSEYEYCSDRGLPIMAVKPMRGGQADMVAPEALRVFRTQHRDWSPATWALRWFADKRNVRVIISGARTPEQLKENAKAVSATKSFNGPEAMAINEVCEITHAKQLVQCTSCFACCKVCPKSLYIPGMLEVYNRIRSGGVSAAGVLKNMVADRSPASCDGCGKCLAACASRIDIPGILGALAADQRAIRELSEAGGEITPGQN